MYAVGLINLATDNRADSLEKELRSRAKSLKLLVHFLDWADNLADLTGPAVIVYLGTDDSPGDALCADRVRRCIENGLPILPVVEDRNLREDQTPQELQYVKSLDWASGATPPEELITTVLEMLGITEKERRLFISYRQSDATEVAIPLFKELSTHRFSVFLDRFTTAAGEDIQERIDEAMEEKARIWFCVAEK